MSDQNKNNNGSLVPAGRRDLVPIVAANPLVSRGIADLIKDDRIHKLVVLKDNALLHYNRGEACLAMEDYDKAIKEFDNAIWLFDEAIRLDPNNAFAYLHRGKAGKGKEEAMENKEDYGGVGKDYERRKNDLDEAIRLFDEAIRLDPQNAFAFLHRGEAWFAKTWADGEDEYVYAIKDFDEAIRLDPNNSFAYLQRGNTWADWRCYDDKAIKDFDEAVRLKPQNAVFYNRRGIAWYFKKDFDKAIADFDEAIRLDPDNRYAYRRRSFVWLGTMEFDKAIENSNEAILLRPTDPFFHYQRGEAWLGKEEFDTAIKDYEEALRLSPKKYAGFALTGRGIAWLFKKDYDKAIKDFGEAIRFHPIHFFHFYPPLSWSYRPGYFLDGTIDLFKIYKANADFHEAIWLDQRSRFAQGKLAWLLATCPEDKVRDGKRAVELAMDVCKVTNWKTGFDLDTLAAAYAEAGQFEEAVRYETKALEDTAYQGPAGNEFRHRLEFYKRKKPFRQTI